jgi:hypothetical protein
MSALGVCNAMAPLTVLDPSALSALYHRPVVISPTR